MDEIFVPEPKLEEIYKKNSCQRIVESGTCLTFFYQNEEWVCIGSCSSGAEGIISTSAYRIVERSAYKGDLEPLPPNEHHHRQRGLNLERGYVAMLVTSAKREMVIYGPQITFKKLEVGKQLALF